MEGLIINETYYQKIKTGALVKKKKLHFVLTFKWYHQLSLSFLIFTADGKNIIIL